MIHLEEWVLTYTEVNGDLFEYWNKAYLVHCISADFALGKGIALEFNRRFRLREKLQLYKPNYLSYYKINNIQGDVIFVGSIVNLVTKERYYQKPTYSSIRQALEKFAQVSKMNRLENIAMPLIGCGLDRLEWSKVSAIIKEVFADQDCNIIVVKR